MVTRRFSLSAVWAFAGRTVGRSSGAGRVLAGALIWVGGGVVTVVEPCFAACDAAEVEKRRGIVEGRRGWNCL